MFDGELSFALKLAREMGRPDWRAMLAGMSSTEYADWHRFYSTHYFHDVLLDMHFSGLTYTVLSLFFSDPDMHPLDFSLLNRREADEEPEDDVLMQKAAGLAGGAVTISDDHNFDRQIIIPPIIFNGIAYDDPGSGNNPGGTRYTGYGFEVRKNGVLIASRETKGAIPGSYSAVIDMPSGGGSVTLEFKIFQKGNQGAGNITDCTVIVTKKAASGISIR